MALKCLLPKILQGVEALASFSDTKVSIPRSVTIGTKVPAPRSVTIGTKVPAPRSAIVCTS